MSPPAESRWFKTKIIATLGPASANRQTLAGMLDAGLDACRLNFSHGSLADHERSLELLRALAAERGAPLCVIGDLCGPKVRLGTFPDGAVEVQAGQSVRVVRGEGACTAERWTVSYAGFVDDVAVGHRIYVDDGLVRLTVTERTADALVCSCTTGGVVNSRKGVNLPDTHLAIPPLTDKDRADLDWAIQHGLDYVALSFVREPEDLYALQRLIKQKHGETRVIIKIEKAEALAHLDELIGSTDVVLVARGDLGVETDLWRVPLIQKDLVARCQEAGVPVIVATQMLQSMVNSPMPTRAEVSDVANAIFDRVDAVMLSAETAVGRYPIPAVEMMNRIAAATEEHLAKRPCADSAGSVAARYRPAGAVAHAAVQAARDLGARLVAVWSATGATVRMVAKHRLPMPVVGLTPSARVYRQINLLFGVVPILVEPMSDPAQMTAVLDRELLQRHLVLPGDLIVVVSSRRLNVPGATDTTLVHRVGTQPEEV